MAATVSSSCISSAVCTDKVRTFLPINCPPSNQLTAHFSHPKRAAGASVGRRRRRNGSKRDFVIRIAEPETMAATADLMSTFSLPAVPGFSLAADNPW
ncbi:hypothetical protein F511_41526 [Dorcoceras hygrometricum]|uniref:Uncharacterized protein n=1 Tax=Dorcoceras hygrometricum TaxID=472368 RepID=A0A2Z7D7H9_9LAMI|nr:hypothetical protein F511_27564 [Dorcoceras hygrometricum]KZV58670.1 hypothetical protein F511_41526 [Dorcoceras hygrometricum]